MTNKEYLNENKDFIDRVLKKVPHKKTNRKEFTYAINIVKELYGDTEFKSEDILIDNVISMAYELK